MSDGLTSGIISIVVLAINLATLFRLFPTRFKLRYCVLLLVLFVGALYVYLLMSEATTFSGTRAVLLFPLLLWLLKGHTFQKLFAFFLTLVLTISLMSFTAAAVSLFVRAESDVYNVIRLAASIVVCAVYIVLVFRFGWQILDRLFVDGHSHEWVLYSLGGLFSYVIIVVLQLLMEKTALLFFVTLFVLWSFGILCFAIINTHEKSKQRYEANFARNIVSSGRDHYQKMNELRDAIRVMRHDYKYHLSAARQMLLSGNQAEAENYLSGIEQKLSENEVPDFCANAVINALLVSYAERCSKHNIKYDIKITLPDPLTIPNYDMCIVLGNLLENAVEACEKQDNDRIIDMIVNSRGAQLAVMVKNSFSGKLIQCEGLPVSGKQDGGLGLKSVQTVAMRYDGEFITKWDEELFTAYVLLSL